VTVEGGSAGAVGATPWRGGGFAGAHGRRCAGGGPMC
jgi:hypothetical protein